MHSLKKLFQRLLKLFGIYTPTMATQLLYIPKIRIKTEINKGNIKAFCIFNRYLIWRNSLTKFESRINDEFIYDINVDDLNFKMTFLDYPFDYPINQRIEGIREPQTTSIIRSIVRDGSNVLELGGCYGYFTAIMAMCVGESGKVVSIEGTPNNFNILSKNVEINNFKNIDLHQVFLRSEENSDDVYFDSEVTHPYEVIESIKQGKSFNNIEEKVAVRCVQLSSFLSEINFIPDHIFMDIEGFEAEVFEDLSHGYLKENRPTIVFETHEGRYAKFKDLRFIMDILKTNNYYYRYDKDNLICLPH